MTQKEQLVKELTAKDEAKALNAAKYMIDNADTEMFQLLADKSEFLFDFVKNNVSKRLQKAVNKDNFMNLTAFLKIYCPDFEDTIMGIFADYADEELTDKMLELLEHGTESEKTYSAKYFNYIPDHLDRIEACCRLVSELGYKPVFFAEGLLGNKAWENK